MLSFLASCSISTSPKSQGACLQQRLAREADANAGRRMCRKRAARVAAVRFASPTVTDLRKQHIRQACMAECDPKHKRNTTGHQPALRAAADRPASHSLTGRARSLPPVALAAFRRTCSGRGGREGGASGANGGGGVGTRGGDCGAGD